MLPTSLLLILPCGAWCFLLWCVRCFCGGGRGRSVSVASLPVSSATSSEPESEYFSGIDSEARSLGLSLPLSSSSPSLEGRVSCCGDSLLDCRVLIPSLLFWAFHLLLILARSTHSFFNFLAMLMKRFRHKDLG